MKVSPPRTPQEIRDLLRTDAAVVTDQQLLALVLAKGSARGRPGKAKKSWTTVALAKDLYEMMGGCLSDLVEKTHANEINLTHFGLGESVGSRLIAGMDLAHRWRCGFKESGDSTIWANDRSDLRRVVFARRGTPSEADLIAVILGSTYPDTENTTHLLNEFGTPQDLMTSLALDVFESFRKDGAVHFRLPQTNAAIEFGSFCRLLAAVELARRYCAQTGPTPIGLEPGAFGLNSVQLVQLLDPLSPLEREFRTGMIEMLRSHPDLTEDFAKLDVLASDAQTDNYHHAIELALMFEQLRKHQAWTHPSEVLGHQIPYGALLAIAEARIGRASGSPGQLLKIKALLEQAERDAIAEPVEGFVEALLALRVSTASAKKATTEARRRYLEKAGTAVDAA